jgi:hypothetical protein
MLATQLPRLILELVGYGGGAAPDEPAGIRSGNGANWLDQNQLLHSFSRASQPRSPSRFTY